MTRACCPVSLAIAVVALATGASSAAQPPARPGPLPVEAFDLPADTRFVLGLDVPRFTASPFYRRHGQPGSPMRLQVFEELRQKAGLDPERDLRRIVVAGFAAPRQEGVALIFGELDVARLDQALRSGPAKAARVGDSQVTVYRLAEGKRGPLAAAILGPRCLLLGSAGVVEEMVARRGQRTLVSNAELLALIERVPGDPTFWLAGDGGLLAQAGSAAGGASAASLGLPPIKRLLVSATFEPQFVLALAADVGEATAAQKLADMLRGFVGLMALQAQQKPALAGLGQAVTIDVAGTELRLRGQLTQEQLEALVPSKPAQAPASPATPPANGPAPGVR